MVSELYAGLPTVPPTFVLMSLAIVVTHYTVHVNGMLAAVVSNEPRTLKDFILRPNQNLCQTGREQTPSTPFTANKSGVHKFAKDLGVTSKLQTPEASSTLRIRK
jgi:hypothetical protein